MFNSQQMFFIQYLQFQVDSVQQTKIQTNVAIPTNKKRKRKNAFNKINKDYRND